MKKFIKRYTITLQFITFAMRACQNFIHLINTFRFITTLTVLYNNHMRNLLKTKEKILAQKANKTKILPVQTNFITLNKMTFQSKSSIKDAISNEKLEDLKKIQLKSSTYYFGCYSPVKNKSQQCPIRQSFKAFLGLKSKKTRTFTRVSRFFTTRSVDLGSNSPKQNQHPNTSKNMTFLKLNDYDLFAVNGIRKRINSETNEQQDHERLYHIGQLLKKRKNSYLKRLDYQKKALKNKFFKDKQLQQSDFQVKIKKIRQEQGSQFKPWSNEPQEQEVTQFLKYN